MFLMTLQATQLISGAYPISPEPRSPTSKGTTCSSRLTDTSPLMTTPKQNQEPSCFRRTLTRYLPLLVRVAGGVLGSCCSNLFDQGATDDGMGVATLLQLVDYFSKNRPKRDVIFNINNGEEDGLNGAHAFLEHPWSALPTVFLNLEGAGSGGSVSPLHTQQRQLTKWVTLNRRPQLFRTSGTGLQTREHHFLVQ